MESTAKKFTIYRAIPFTFNDGGREAAGFKGFTKDCVARAIAIASDTPYLQVYTEINSLILSKRQTKRIVGRSSRTGVPRRIAKEYLEARGWVWTPTMHIGSGCTVHLGKGELPMGRLIVSLSKHYAAVIDGVLNDTHDCTRDGTRCVYGYYMQP
jgi:hypothetical protein